MARGFPAAVLVLDSGTWLDGWRAVPVRTVVVGYKVHVCTSMRAFLPVSTSGPGRWALITPGNSLAAKYSRTCLCSLHIGMCDYTLLLVCCPGLVACAFVCSCAGGCSCAVAGLLCRGGRFAAACVPRFARGPCPGLLRVGACVTARGHAPAVVPMKSLWTALLLGQFARPFGSACGRGGRVAAVFHGLHDPGLGLQCFGAGGRCADVRVCL